MSNGAAISESPGWYTIDNKVCNEYNITPKRFEQMALKQKCSGSLKEMTVFTLSNTIFIGVCTRKKICELHPRFQERYYMSSKVFLGIIRMENSYFCVKLSLNHTTKGLNNMRNFISGSQQMQQGAMREISNKCNKISIAIQKKN